MSAQQADDQIILTVRNTHPDPCPIDFAPETAAFLSYFEGLHGDQWVLRWDGKANHAVLSGGDIEWKSVAVFIGTDRSLDIVLNESEAAWLKACMLVVNRRAASQAQAGAA